MKKFLIILLFGATSTYGQNPKLSGTIDINLSEGKITCNFTITNIPKLDDPAFALNRVFNIHDLKINDKSFDYIIDYGFPARSSFLADGVGIVPNMDTITNETKISITYTSAFPTYKENEEVASGDNMGAIVFKNNIVRASHQSLWYPVLMDRTTNLILSKYVYAITVTCKECESIYIGGSNPTHSKRAFLKTNAPNDLMLYSGKYKFSKMGNTYFLNSHLKSNEQKAINNSMDSIRNFYSNIIKTNTQEPITLAEIFSIGYKTQYEKWAFSVYPCIVGSISEIPTKFDFTKNQFRDIETFRIYSHELAHQYFGLKVKSNNEFWGFYSESFAEYMCLKAIEKTFGKEKYIAFIKQRYLTKKAMSKKYIQPNSIKSDIDNLHKYNYYPLVLLGLEQTVGQSKMFNFLDFLTNKTTSTFLNYETLNKQH